MDTEPRTVQANGITLAYRVWGPQDAPPLLLLHARGLDGADRAAIAPALATGPRRVYAPDLRGHGRSDWPGRYAYETIRDDVHAFLAALGVDRADVVGHSLGGAVAYLLAQRHPEVVRRLVLEDVPAPYPLDPPRPPAERPAGELPFDWAMMLATDAQRNRSCVVGSHGADHHAHAADRGRTGEPDSAGAHRRARRSPSRRPAHHPRGGAPRAPGPAAGVPQGRRGVPDAAPP